MLTHNFFDSFKSAGLRQGWWNSNKMAVALSGGSDSMALLWLMVNLWEGNLVAFHVDHGIRGESSSSDARFVQSYCKTIGVPCHVIQRDVPGESQKGESIELAARRIRHESLSRYCRDTGCSGVVLGHNADDVVETFFLNLARGSGPFGLAGIPETNGCLYRPIMDIPREDLRDILRDAGWSWVDDETNDQDIYLRNRIRNEILPMMEKRINPAIRRHVLSLVEDMADLRAQEEREGRSIALQLKRDLPLCLFSLSRSEFKELSPVHKAWVLRYVGRELGLRTLSRKRTQELIDLEARSTRWRFQWSSDVELCSDRRFLSWVRRSVLRATPPEPVELKEQGQGTFGDLAFSWSFLDSGTPFLSDFSVAVPMAFSDRVEIKPLASVFHKDRYLCPWWLLSHVPVVTVRDIPVWSPNLGFLNLRWDFPSDSVEYESLCLVNFSDRQEGEPNRWTTKLEIF